MYAAMINRHKETKMTRLTLSIQEAIDATGIGRTKLYEILKSGQLPAKKLGKRTLILSADVEAFLSGLKNYPTQAEMLGGKNG